MFAGDSAVPSNSLVLSHLFALREAFAQIGVEASWHPFEFRPVPSGVDFDDDFLVMTNIGTTTRVTREAAALIRQTGTYANTNDIHVFYVRNGAYTPGSSFWGAQLRPGALVAADAGYAYNIFINWDDSIAGPISRPFVIAHETGHLMADDGGHSANSWNLMFGTQCSSHDAVTNTVRLDTAWANAIMANTNHIRRVTQ